MSGTCSVGCEKAGAWKSLSMPKVCRTETVMSGRSKPGVVVALGVVAAEDGFADAMVIRSAALEVPETGGKSGEVALLERRIGEVDDLHPLLGRLVAAMDVGVMELHQLLIARLQPDQGEGRLQIEDGQRLLLRRGLHLRLATGLCLGLILDPEHAEILELRPIARADAAAERPARPLPHRVASQLGLDLRRAHPGIVVPGGVVGAHMVEAEPVELLQIGARSRRAMLTAGGTARMVAGARRRRGVRLGGGFGKIKAGHGLSMGGGYGADKHRRAG